MKTGIIVEFIDRHKIVCAVVLEVKNRRLRLLTEANRELKLSESRILHESNINLDVLMGRDKLSAALKETACRREILIKQIDIKELWEVLHTEQEWIDLDTMTTFCFSEPVSCDHKAAVARAFFKNRLYFKFDNNRFFPNTVEKVDQVATQLKEALQRKKIIEDGANWLKNVINSNDTVLIPKDKLLLIEILKSYYLFEKASKHYMFGKTLLEKAGIKRTDNVLKLLVKLGAWDLDENIDLYRHEIPLNFSNKVKDSAANIVRSQIENMAGYNKRKDFTNLPMMTIDGPLTLDFDDAISLEKTDDYYRVGIHIADVGHFVKKGDFIDKAAMERGSSIYMMERKISMIPSLLSEDACSLKHEKVRPAISIMANLTPVAEVVDYEIFPSIIKVKQQLTYHDASMMLKTDENISTLYNIAMQIREKRLNQGAVQISLPEIEISTDENDELSVEKIDREDPCRILVMEIMILANWIMAQFLTKNNLPAIFRSQPAPRERLFKKDEKGSLFQNWMQRKHLSRVVLSHEPEHHSGLGLNAYVTATSPIRRYFDLATQRQIRVALDMEKPYTNKEIRNIMHVIEQPMRSVSIVQNNRQRYWLLKYLETKVGQIEEAIVLGKMRNDYSILLKQYMIECSLPISIGIKLKPEDLIHVQILHVNARKNALSVFFV